MTSLDLNPLTPEVIQKMGYTPQDLWLVKLGNEVYGPFEVESLKHYASENDMLFAEALATRLDHQDWQPFVEQSVFAVVADKIAHEEQVSHYWLLMKGQRTGPYSVQDMHKKMELELIAPHDLVSTDDGHTWKKFFQMSTFFVKSSVNDLPSVPGAEISFMHNSQEQDETLDNAHSEPMAVGLARLAFLGQSKERVTLNLEEIDLKSLQQTEVSRNMKWAVPSAVASIAILAFMGLNILSGPSMDEVAVEEEKSASPEAVVTHTAPNGSLGQPSLPQEYRRPASVPRYERSGLTAPRETFYPTHVETHQSEPDPMMDQPQEVEANPAPDQEPSLVSQNSQEGLEPTDGQSLDQAMGEAVSGEPQAQPPEPVIEEATDF